MMSSKTSSAEVDRIPRLVNGVEAVTVCVHKVPELASALFSFCSNLNRHHFASGTAAHKFLNDAGQVDTLQLIVIALKSELEVLL